jgi:hypothetical protein
LEFLDTSVRDPGFTTVGITRTLQFGNALPKDILDLFEYADEMRKCLDKIFDLTIDERLK